MTRRILTALLAAACTLTIASTSQAVTFTGPARLVNRADRWQAHSRMPLGNETIQIMPRGFCWPGDPAGCSQPGKVYARTRWAFYFELGHQFDWTYLTDPDRQWLAAKWGVSTAAWWDSLASLNRGGEDGLQGDFASWFQGCALGYRQLGVAFRITGGPIVRSGNFNVCNYLRYLEAHS